MTQQMHKWWIVVVMCFTSLHWVYSQCTNTRIVAIMVNACGEEPRNEFVVIYTENGFNTADIRLDYDNANNVMGNQNNDIGVSPCGIGFGNIDGYTGCTSSQLIPVGNDFDVLPRSIVILQTSNNANHQYNFSELCNDPFYACLNKYIISSTCARTVGAFTDITNGANRITRFSIQGEGCTQTINYNVNFNIDGMYLLPPANNNPQISGCFFPNIIVPNPAEPDLNPFFDDSGCTIYEFPEILGNELSGNEGYYTGPNGTGTKYFAGETIIQTTLVYIYDRKGSCMDEEGPYNITVVNPATASLLNLTGSVDICPDQCVEYRLNISGWQSGVEYFPFIEFNIPGVQFPPPIDPIVSTLAYDFRICVNPGDLEWDLHGETYNIPPEHIGKQIGMYIDSFEDLNGICDHNYSETPIQFNILENPIANIPQPLQQSLSGGMATFNLSERDDEVLDGQMGTVEWYSDQNEATIIPNPESYAITEETTVFARVSNQACFSEYVPLLLQITGSQVTVTIEADTLVCAPDSNGAILSFRYVFDNPQNDTIEFCPIWIRDGIPLSPPSITITTSEPRSISFSSNNEETLDSLVLDIKVCDESTLPAGVEVQTPATPFVIYVNTPPPIDDPTFLTDTVCLENGVAGFDLEAISTVLLEGRDSASITWYLDSLTLELYTDTEYITGVDDSLYFTIEEMDCDFGPYTFRFVPLTPDTVFVTMDTLSGTTLCGYSGEGEEVMVRWMSNHPDIDVDIYIRYIIDGTERDSVLVLSGGEVFFAIEGVMQSAVFITDSVTISSPGCFITSFSSDNTLSIEVLEVPEIDAPDTLSDCGSLQLPAIINAQGDTLLYFTQPGGMGMERFPGFAFNFVGGGNNQHTLYVRDTFGICQVEKEIRIIVFNNDAQNMDASLDLEGNPSILCEGVERKFLILIHSNKDSPIHVQYSLRIQTGQIDTIITDTATFDIFKPINIKYFEGDPFFTFLPGSDTIKLGGMNQPLLIILESIHDVNGCPIPINTFNNKHTINYLFDIPVHEPQPLITCDNGNGQGIFDLRLRRNEINGMSGRIVRYYRDSTLMNSITVLNPYASPSATIFARVDVEGCFSEVVPLELQVVESEMAHISITHNNPAQLCDFDTIPGETISVTFSTSNQALDYTIYYKTIIDGTTVNREISLTGVVQDATAHLPAMRSYSLQIDSVKADNGTCPINITWDQDPVTVNVTRVPQINLPNDLSICGEFILPPLMSDPPSATVTYYSGRRGMGSTMAAGQTVTSTSTIYAYFEEGICTAEDSFIIEIFQQSMAEIPRDTSDCGSYILPEITGTDGTGFAYFTEENGMGTMFLPGDTITETTTLFVFDTTGLCPDDQGPFTITIFNSPDLSGMEDITFCDSLIISDLNIVADSILYTLNGEVFQPGDVIIQGGQLLIQAWLHGCESNAFINLTMGISGSIGNGLRDNIIDWCFNLPFRPQDFLDESASPGQFFGEGGQALAGDSLISLTEDEAIFLYSFISPGTEGCPGDTASFSIFGVFDPPNAGVDLDTLFCVPTGTITLRDFVFNGDDDGRFELPDGSPVEDENINLQPDEMLSVSYIVDHPVCGSDTALLIFRVSGFTNITALLTESDLCEGECAEWQLSPNSAEDLIVHYTLDDGDETTSHTIHIPTGMGRTIFFCNTETGAGNIVLLEPDRSYQIRLDSIVSESGCVYTDFAQESDTLRTHGESEESLIGSFCTGDTVRIAGLSFTQSTDTIIVRPGVAPGVCDSTYIISIIFEDFIEDIIPVDLCSGDTIVINGLTLDGSETEVSIVVPDLSGEGCDTLRTYVVTLLEPQEAVIDTIFCDEAEFIMVNGMRYDINNPVGSEIIMGGADNGCDSIITVMLEYRLPVIERLDTTLCDEDDVLIVSGQTFDFDNPFDSVFVGMAANGCDSIIIVDITYEIVEPVEINISTCDSNFTFALHGVTFDINNPSAQIIIPGISSAGCDSIYNVNITFGNEISDLVLLALCRGETLEVDGFIFDENNLMATITIPDNMGDGCDTVRTYRAEILEPATQLIERVFCDENEVLMVGNEEFSISNPNGTVTIEGGAANGCDSIITVMLEYNMTVEENIDTVICDPDFSLEINGQVYDINNPTGVERFEGAASGGCDSIVNISLHFESEIITPLNISTCDPLFSIEVNGTTYDINQPVGTEVFAGGTVQGCDSIVEVNIRFFFDVVDSLVIDLCAGHTIEINGTVYDENRTSGVDTLFGASSFGCDSIVHVFINLLESPSFALVELFCDENEFLLINDERYDINRPTGVQVLNAAAANGCDSTVFIALVFRPLRQGTFDTIVCDPSYSVVVNGTLYDFENPEGMERFTSNDPSACDSVLNVRLQFVPYPEGEQLLEICRGETVVLHGREYSEFVTSGVDTLINAAVNGCDSIVHVSVVINDATEGDLIMEVCDPEAFFMVNGERYDINRSQGVETIERANQFGCDSTVFIDLTYLDNPVSFIDTLLCNLDYFLLVNGVRYDINRPTGMEVLMGQAANGCDSTVVIDLFYEADEVEYRIVPSTCREDSDAVLVIEDITAPLPIAYSLDGIPGMINQLPMVLSFPSGRSVLFEIETETDCFLREMITAPLPDNIRFDITFQLVGDNMFQLLPSSGVAISAYSWEPNPSLSCLNCAEPIATLEARTTFYLTAVTSGGCILMDSVTLAPFSVPAVVAIPNVFSPNGDGVNDYWYVTTTGTEVIQFTRIHIYDRYGNLLWDNRNPVPNDPAEGWDGTFRNRRLNPGVFVYVIEYLDSRGRKRVITGDITIVDGG